MQIHSMKFDPPQGFFAEETMISLRAEPAADQALATPSLIAHSKKARPQASLEELAGEVAAELATSVPGMSGLTTAELTFRDGQVGVLFAYDLPSPSPSGALRQYHALRLDEHRLTSLTLTVPLAGLGDAQNEAYLNTLVSIRKA